MHEKKCTRCKVIRPIQGFDLKGRKSGDKRSSICKECKKPHRKAYSRKYYWDLKNRQKVNARLAVADALRKGVLVKPEACTSCHEPKRLEAHHPDHSKFLDVVWLCGKCHYETDINTKTR